MTKSYPLQASPLYKLRNRRKLAESLALPRNYFRYTHSFHYLEFSQVKPSGNEKRYFSVPEDELKKIQKRLNRLFSRIETPDWLLSGKKHRSYITNASVHINGNFVKTMDISCFYDSAQRSYIYNMFKNTFLMETDIAWILTDLVTYNGKLPTGSPSSQIIIFWAYKEMFENIYAISMKYNCIFSLYVDDMTFSSSMPISCNLRIEVENELKKHGLTAKKRKDHYYQAHNTKIITGVGIKNGNRVVPNRLRKKIMDTYYNCQQTNDIKNIERLRGLLCAARQIEPDIFPSIANYAQLH